MENLDHETHVILHERNEANGVAQRQDPIDEWLAMGASLVDDMRQERARLVARIAVIDLALRKVDKTDPKIVAAPKTRAIKQLKQSDTAIAKTLAALPKHAPEAKTSEEIGALMGVAHTVTQKNLSLLFQRGKARRARDINSSKARFLYWAAK